MMKHVKRFLKFYVECMTIQGEQIIQNGGQMF